MSYTYGDAEYQRKINKYHETVARNKTLNTTIESLKAQNTNLADKKQRLSDAKNNINRIFEGLDNGYDQLKIKVCTDSFKGTNQDAYTNEHVKSIGDDYNTYKGNIQDKQGSLISDIDKKMNEIQSAIRTNIREIGNCESSIKKAVYPVHHTDGRY